MLQTIADWVEKQVSWVVAGVAAIYFLGMSAVAWTKLMWLDEISTYIPATYAGWMGLWEFFASGGDVHTPVSAAIMRLSIVMFGDNGWSVRLPYIAGYLLLFLGCYRFTAKRAGVLWGLVAGLFVLVTPTIEYATEARPYAFMMGLGATAAVAWQELGEKINNRRVAWLAVLVGSLALGVSLHFFFLFVLIPLAAAEWWRWRECGRRDWTTAAVIVLAPVAYLPFVPGILKARAVYASTYWSKPQLSGIEESYRFLLTLAFFPLVAALLAWAVGRSWWRKEDSRPSAQAGAAVPQAEWVLVAVWSLMPVFMVLGSFLLGAFVTRYALPSITGLSILLAWLCWRRSGNDVTLALVLAGVFLAWFGWKTLSTSRRQWNETGGYPQRATDGFKPRKWYQAAASSPLPVIVTPAVLFTQLSHYAAEPLRRRVVYPLSARHALEFDGTDSGDRWLMRVANAGKLPVVDAGRFFSEHQTFLMLANTAVPTWHLEFLRRRGARVEYVERDAAQILLRVSMPDAAPSEK